MTINQLAVLLLNDFSPEERSIPDHVDFPNRNVEVLKAINAALQEVFGEGSAWIRYDQIGFLVHAPTTVTISVTNDTYTAYITEGYAEWMHGCSISITGDEVANSIRGLDTAAEPVFQVSGSLTSDGSTAVVFPLLLPTGFVNQFSSTGSVDIPATGSWYGVKRNATGPVWFTAEYYEDYTPIATWESEDDVATPDLVTTWTPSGSETGTPSFTRIPALRLKTPYSGTTGSKTATVNQNCISIPDSVMEVCEPVSFKNRRIFPINTAGPEYERHQRADYGSSGFSFAAPAISDMVSATGIPVAYAVETWSKSDTAQPGTRMMLVPAPDSAGTLEIRSKLAPPVVTSLTSTSTLPIPQQFVHSIFFPIVRKHLSGCPFFLHSSAGEEIQRAYQEAHQLLRKLRPSKNQGQTFRSIN